MTRISWLVKSITVNVHRTARDGAKRLGPRGRGLLPSCAMGWSSFVGFMRRHRRRIQLALIAAFVVAITLIWGGSYPREVTVALRVAESTSVTEAQIDFTQDDEPVRSITRRFPAGAPSPIRETVSLSPGDYDVSVLLTRRDGGIERRTARLTSPAEGVVHLRVSEGS